MFKDKQLRKEFEKFKKQVGHISTQKDGSLLYPSGQLGELDERKVNKEDIVECDICGCLIYKDKAIKKKVISKEKTFDCMTYKYIEGEICTTKYYCKRCGKKKMRKEIGKIIIK